MRRPLRRAKFLAKRLKRRRVFVVAIDVPQQAAQLVEGVRIEPPVFLQAVARPRPELLKIPSGLGHADDRYIKMPALHHRLQRQERFFYRPDRRSTPKKTSASE